MISAVCLGILHNPISWVKQWGSTTKQHYIRCSPKLRMKGHLSAAEEEKGISKLPLQSRKLWSKGITLGTTAVHLWSLPLNDYLQKLSSSVMPHKGYLFLPHHTSEIPLFTARILDYKERVLICEFSCLLGQAIGNQQHLSLAARSVGKHSSYPGFTAPAALEQLSRALYLTLYAVRQICVPSYFWCLTELPPEFLPTWGHFSSSLSDEGVSRRQLFSGIAASLPSTNLKDGKSHWSLAKISQSHP